MTTVKGTNIHCGIANPTTNAFTQFAFSRKASVTMKRDMQEVSSPTSGQYKEYIPGRKGWKMSVGCLLSNDETTVWDAYDNGEKIWVSWRETQGTECREFCGYAYVTNVKATGNMHEMATFDIELQGTGALYYRRILYAQVYYTDQGSKSGLYRYWTISLWSDPQYTVDSVAPCDIIFNVGTDKTLTINQGNWSNTSSVLVSSAAWPTLVGTYSNVNITIQPEQ